VSKSNVSSITIAGSPQMIRRQHVPAFLASVIGELRAAFFRRLSIGAGS